MRILIICISVVLIFSSCQQQGSLTHTEAYLALHEIYLQKDSNRFNSLLSENSKRYIQKIAFSFKSLDPVAKKNLAKILGLDDTKIDEVTEENYAALYFALNTSYKRDLITRTLDHNAVSINTDGERASFLMSNNVILYFVKEAPYWKFDLEKSLQ